MTSFVLIVGGVVVQKQPYPADGFIAAPDDVVCGMLFSGGVFSPPEQSSANAPYRLYKSVFIRRLTESEAATMEAVLAAADARLRLLFNSVEYFVSDDELFATLVAAVGQALGSDRADDLLAAG